MDALQIHIPSHQDTIYSLNLENYIPEASSENGSDLYP
jgi:hypothetical protein